MFNLHAKKIYTKYDKISVFEKNPRDNYHRQRKHWVKLNGISLLFSKITP